MDTKPHILIVDDDQDLRELLDSYLSREAYKVSTAANGLEMDKFLSEFRFDVIILDLMLPIEDGLSILRRIASTIICPVIILSAKGQDIDKITGLEVGADDYLAKPFNPRELLARIRALLRRGQNKPAVADSIEFGSYQYFISTQQLFKDDEEVALTTSEAIVLDVLVTHTNQVLSRDDIMNNLHKNLERHPYDRSIDIHITRLRKKLEENPSKPRYIQTIWGKGYRFISETAV